ncbi:hypothetical protein N7462_004807 [Penicillium macrosclerotiorum]|uniref:uncharacterized protein n=1 Tax=Penicillium macrosclerotiorum TaxID=303699 RepID=UPI002548B835|nr:uncharacterized protein N7462_004807 [Penicillium macrosclerotiorum]KAJ5690415.1 hypothetical protein N7462_004807 [Penicillium macrosclerotiorum]
MGYTHYWGVRDWNASGWKEAWPKLIHDVPLIIEACGVELSGPTDDAEIVTPVLADVEKGLDVNGASDDAYEPLIIKPNGDDFFCKTARRPYDAVVTSILLRAFMLAGPKEFSVSSDGYWDEWNMARSICGRLWPNESIECPWGEQAGEEAEWTLEDSESLMEDEVANEQSRL